MKKPVVMFDIDGVVTDNSSLFLALKKEYPTVDPLTLNSYNIAESLLEQGVINSLEEHSDREFFTKYESLIYNNAHMKRGFLTFYKKLRLFDTFRLVFVTARDYNETLYRMTHLMLDSFGIDDAELHLVGSQNKLDYMHTRDMHPIAIFEDKPETLEDSVNRGFATFCVGYSYNKTSKCTVRLEDFTMLDMTVFTNVLSNHYGTGLVAKVN